MSFLSSLNIAGSALTAERLRMDIITQNISNANVTRTEDGGPYQRQQVVFESNGMTFDEVLGSKTTGITTSGSGGVRVTEIVKNENDFVPVYDPDHPDADEAGYVLMPNVNMTEEQLDLMAATRAYEANISALNIVKAMTMLGLEIGN